MKVSIIGTAGKRDDAPRMSLSLYKKMVRTAESWIKGRVDSWRQVHLVSGGAAWADHVAISLYKLHPEARLTLHLPCPWDHAHQKFLDSGERDFKLNPGGTSNFYHREFSDKVGSDTLRGIHEVVSSGAPEVTIVEGKGLFERNAKVAKSEVILAFTFGVGDTPKDGGTRYTWDLASHAERVHFSLVGM